MIPQITMAAWLLFGLFVFGRLALAPRMIRIDGKQCRTIALYAVAGALGEAVTLWAGDFW